MYKSLTVMALGIFMLIGCRDSKPKEIAEAIIKNPYKADSSRYQKPLILPPIADLDPRYLTFTFDASKGTTFRLPSGSEIVVPADALTDANGQKIKGKTTFKYREMHDAISIFLAGIPMNYKSGNFTTAGSFELRSETGAQLTKPVEVKMASYTGGADYNFYYLNENKRNWDSIGWRKPDVNLEKNKLLQKIENQRLKQPFSLNRQYFAFNYMAILDVYFNDDWKTLNQSDAKLDSIFKTLNPHLAAYDMGWEYNYFSNRDVITWEGVEYPAMLFVWKNVNKTPFPVWAKDHYYGKLTPIKNNRYVYSIENQKENLKFDVEIEAVMPLKTLFAFTPEQWKNQYAATMKQVKMEQERASKMANLYRTFQVNQFGLYNWDKLMKDENAVVLEANFDFPIEVNSKLTDLDVIYISGDNKGIITFAKASWDKLALIPDTKGRLFTLMPGNILALFDKDKYGRLKFEEWRKQKTPQYQFEMEGKHIIKTEADLRRILNI